MFEKNIYIKGIHADYMKRLAANIDGIIQKGIFARNLDVYMLAPIIGVIYSRRATTDNESRDITPTSIHTEQILAVIDQLEYNYRLVMLLHDKKTLPIEERMNRAFRYDRNEEMRAPGDQIFEEYVLGGIEVLFENIMKDSSEANDYIKKIFNFVCEFQERYNSQTSDDDILKICNIARN